MAALCAVAAAPPDVAFARPDALEAAPTSASLHVSHLRDLQSMQAASADGTVALVTCEPLQLVLPVHVCAKLNSPPMRALVRDSTHG